MLMLCNANAQMQAKHLGCYNHHQEEGSDGANCLADELPHGGCHCMLLQLPAAAQAQPTEPSIHSLRVRLHSDDSSHEPTYTHSCGEQ
jgi:hypothetical protein